MRVEKLKKGKVAGIPILLVLLFCLLSARQTAESFTPYEITNTMFAKTKEIRTMTYTMKKTERINGKTVVQKSSVKLNRKPYKIYVKQMFPHAGAEVLFIEGKNNNNALVNPNGFPWINLNLDPMGSIMRKDQHHTIFDSGYDLFISILEYQFNKYGNAVKSMLKKDTVTWDGYPCWKISVQNPNFKFIAYKVKPGETVEKIADSMKISGYMILERNEQIDASNDISAGDVIEIPNDYAPELILYIDQKRMLPLGIKVYDDKGLFEQYEFSNVKVNVPIKPEEFTEDYEAYGF